MNKKDWKNKLISLPEKVLEDLKVKADLNYTKMKPYLEKVLIDHSKEVDKNK